MSIGDWLNEADAVLIGAGAGLSVAAGIDSGEEDDFKRAFPVMYRKGFRAALSSSVATISSRRSTGRTGRRT